MDSRETLAAAKRRAARRLRSCAAASLAESSRIFADSIVVAALPQELEALVEQAPRCFVVVFFQGDKREARDRAQDSPCVVEAAVDGEALLEQLASPRVVVL